MEWNDLLKFIHVMGNLQQMVNVRLHQESRDLDEDNKNGFNIKLKFEMVIEEFLIFVPVCTLVYFME